MTAAKVKTLKLTDIRLDGATQQRAKIPKDGVEEYAKLMKLDNVEFPPVVVFFDGKDNWLADGFMRYEARKSCLRTDIEAEIRHGTKRDAILFSVGANAGHGLKRTNADKRKAVRVLLNDEEWRKLSARQIAKLAGVHHDLVVTLRQEVAESAKKDSGEVITQTNTESATQENETVSVNGQELSLAADIDAELDSEEEADEPEPTIEDDIKQHNGRIEAFCRKLMKLVDEEMPRDDPWLQHNGRDESARAKFKDGCSTLRSCKCQCVCPMCKGEGCRHCHKTGRVTTYAYQQLV